MNPSVRVPAGEIAQPKQRRTLVDYVALAIATCGVGYIPIAPGTWGSLVGVAIFYKLRPLVFEFYVTHFWRSGGEDDAWRLFSLSLFSTAFLAVLIVALSLIGIWAASRAERLFGRKDPKQVVIDEVVGQLVTLVFLFEYVGPVGILIGFLLFRAFDIIKPYPVRRIEELPGGLGIVADDILAGLYAGILLLLIHTIGKIRLGA